MKTLFRLVFVVSILSSIYFFLGPGKQKLAQLTKTDHSENMPTFQNDAYINDNQTSQETPEKVQHDIFYRWQDSKGMWHFSQIKPKNVAAITMKVHSSSKGLSFDTLKNALSGKTETNSETQETEKSNSTESEHETPKENDSLSMEKLLNLIHDAKQVQNLVNQQAEKNQSQ